MEENNKLDNIEFETNSQASVYWKLLSLVAIENKNRIEKLEKDFHCKRIGYMILDFFMLLNVIDVLMKSIFGIGIWGIGYIICKYIVSLFNG